MIQLALLTAVQAQLDPVVTWSALLMPIDVTDTLNGDTVYVQLPAACVNVTVWPATVIVPVRAPVVVLAATVYWTWPSPEGGAEFTVIQLALLTAVHAQLEPVVTWSALLMPIDVTDTLSGDTV